MCFDDGLLIFYVKGSVKRMRRLGFQRILPALCTVALLVCTFGSFAVTVSANTDSVRSVYDDDGDGVVTAWDIIERDGYIEGCWYPWLTHTYLGSSLASNPDAEAWDSFYGPDGTTVRDYWQPLDKIGIDNVGEAQIKKEIFNLKALGFNMMAYMGSPWGEGVMHDTNTWDVTGVRSEYLTNMRRLLNICREVGMPVLWYIHCHSSAVPAYAGLDLWYRITQMYSHEQYRQHYAEKFVKPVCEVLAEYRDVVVMVGLTDELENEINDSQLGDKFNENHRTEYGVTQEDAVAFQAAIGQTVKAVMPDMPTTLASNKTDWAMYADSMLDMVGRNQYGTSTNVSDLSGAYPIGPMLATEFGIGDGSGLVAESEWGSILTAKRDNFLNKGYSGWFHWAYQPTLNSSSAGGNQYLKAGANTVYDFREGMYDGYYWAEAKMAQLKPANHTTGNPSILYYDGKNGNGKIYWIQPKGVTSYSVQRSIDGGNTWVQVSGSVSIDTSTGGYRYCMTDPNARSTGSVQYRVTVNGKVSYGNLWTY